MIDTLSLRGAYRGKTLPETTVQILCDEIDRLRREQQTPQGKTVAVRFKAFVRPNGTVTIPHCYQPPGGPMVQPGGMDGETVCNITATLPVPAEVCVVAKVEGE